MPKTEIINCHIHTFTAAHTPRYFPHPFVAIFRVLPFLLVFLRWVVSLLPYERLTDMIVRLEKFHTTGGRHSQRDIFREVLHYYPRNARFVVLPMDMGLIGHGPVAIDIRAQHDELAQLAADPDYGPQVIPFATLYPDRPGAFDEFRRCVEVHGFRGLKLYTKLGYAPDHPLLVEKVYPYCVAHDLPVMSHCSRGGVYHKGWSQARQDAVTEPRAYEQVLTGFPDLRLCLAHFGGDSDWTALLEDGFDPDDPQARARNWTSEICRMIECGSFPNLYTDISYTIFRFNEYIPLLRLYLQTDTIRDRVLFGSDFYMTRQERLSEKAISIRLRDALGEADFHRIADANPRRWLGRPLPEIAAGNPAANSLTRGAKPI
jgi:predicted TIM-barrel fold metal-dependent hydrolase